MVEPFKLKWEPPTKEGGWFQWWGCMFFWGGWGGRAWQHHLWICCWCWETVLHLFTNTHTNICHVHHPLLLEKKKQKQKQQQQQQLPVLKTFGMIWLAMISENGLIVLIRSSWGLDCFQGWKFARWLKLALPTGTGASAGWWDCCQVTRHDCSFEATHKRLKPQDLR